jgi:hypothetical protein
VTVKVLADALDHSHVFSRFLTFSHVFSRFLLFVVVVVVSLIIHKTTVALRTNTQSLTLSPRHRVTVVDRR